MINEYLQDIKDIELLSEEEEKTLDANELVVHNLRLATSIAKLYQNRGIDLEDLIQEANIGLMIAAKKFDTNRGCKFSTHAAWWIRQRLSKAIVNQSRSIRIPSHINEAKTKIEKAIDQLRAQLNRAPTIKEIAEKVEKTETEIENIISYFLEPVSIDSTFGDDDDNSIGSVIEDTSANFENNIYKQIERETLYKVLETLPERESKIIELRILQEGSLEEVGRIMGLSTERVRQLEMKALRKLRHPYRARVLRETMEE